MYEFGSGSEGDPEYIPEEPHPAREQKLAMPVKSLDANPSVFDAFCSIPWRRGCTDAPWTTFKVCKALVVGDRQRVYCRRVHIFLRYCDSSLSTKPDVAGARVAHVVSTHWNKRVSSISVSCVTVPTCHPSHGADLPRNINSAHHLGNP